jgi:hypothetical protein
MKEHVDEAGEMMIETNPLLKFLFHFRLYGMPSLYECMTGDVKETKSRRRLR